MEVSVNYGYALRFEHVKNFIENNFKLKEILSQEYDIDDIDIDRDKENDIDENKEDNTVENNDINENKEDNTVENDYIVEITHMDDLDEKYDIYDWENIIKIMNQYLSSDDNFKFVIFGDYHHFKIYLSHKIFKIKDAYKYSEQNYFNGIIKYTDIPKKNEIDEYYKLFSEKYNFNHNDLMYNMFFHVEYHGY